ncbi:hypothetical protein Pmani_000804 [Petrolisthes manimaculis]|uniref:Methyltransferase type 11 domain-containing protein n=1 Tax=Petrolisthes manimaculis TaxID=1843537 RepID=A0AAE1QLR0_9EUCA|nr:hypothetical protein Pmani_000804 [Petrolisthes manimaculis]
MSSEESRKEREARSVALERAYVHDVYDQISVHFSGARYRAWPRVRQFLADLEPGAFVADVGCGNGKYLHINQQIVKVGVDRCLNLATTARERGHEVTLSDTLALPFRDECVDAALSIAVIHHLATTERRVRALRELARVLKIGGRLMITVWAMEQRHRKFESQDVLVPWHRPDHSSSDDKTSSIERDLNSTTTDDDDLLHYHAHNHSDSDSCPSHRYGSRKNGRRRTRSRAIDPVGGASSSQSSSDLSSPNESCYSFVRRALQVVALALCFSRPYTSHAVRQKLTSSRRGSSSSGKSWFMHGSGLGPFKSDGGGSESGGSCEPRPSLADNGSHHSDQRPSMSNDGSLDSQDNLDDVPIELRHLEPDDPALLDIPLSPLPALPQPQPHQQLATTTATAMSSAASASDQEVKAKSKSLTDLVQESPSSPLDQISPTLRDKSVSREGLNSSQFSEASASVLRSKSSSSCLSLSSHELCSESPRSSGAVKKVTAHSETSSSKRDNTKKTVSTFSSLMGADGLKTASELVGKLGESIYGESSEKSESGSGEGRTSPISSRKRPALKKQKASINESDPSDDITGSDGETQEPKIVIEISRVPPARQTSQPNSASPADENDEEDDKDHLSIPKGVGIFKQSSLNDEIICLDRFLEKEKIRQSIQKQSSLNEDLIYGNRGGRKESLRESLFATQFRRLQNIRESFQRLRTASLDRFEKEKSDSSFKKGLYKLLQSWKSEILVTADSKPSRASESDDTERFGGGGDGSEGSSHTRDFQDSPTDSRKHTQAIRTRSQSLYQSGRSDSCADEGLERTCSGAVGGVSVGGLVEKKLLGREPSERKPSREESSDSSKENSFQSDTSLDSEDSCVSVIFVPKPGQTGPNNDSDKERNRSVSSESSEGSDKQHSPKSPRSPKSPKSPGPGGAGGMTGANRYFTPSRFLGAKSGIKTGPKMGTQVLGSASKPDLQQQPQQQQQRKTSPPSAEIKEESSSIVPSPVAVPERTRSESGVVREVPSIRTVATGSTRPPVIGVGRAGGMRMGDGSSLARVMGHVGSTPPATPPPTKLTSGSYFSHPLPVIPQPPVPQPHTEPTQPEKSLTSEIICSVTTNIASTTTNITTITNTASANKVPPQTTTTAATTTTTTISSKIITYQTTTPTTTTTTVTATATSSSIKPIPKYEPQVVKRDTSFTQQLSSLLLGENVEIIRKRGNGSGRNVQIVRKTVPRFLTFDVFNPETDDLDSDSSASSSPNSGSSVIERGWPTERDIEELDREIKRREEEERRRLAPSPSGASGGGGVGGGSGSGGVVPGAVGGSGTMGQGERGMSPQPQPTADLPKMSLVEDVHRMDTISEDARENSDLNGGKRRSASFSTSATKSQPTMTRASSITSAFVKQSFGGSRREIEAMKQWSASMGRSTESERRSQLSSVSTSTSSLMASCSTYSSPSSSSSSLLPSSAPALSPALSLSLDSTAEVINKRSPKGRRKLTTAHLDQSLPPQPTGSETRKHTRSPEPLLERQGLRGRMQPGKALSPLGMETMGRGDMKPWAEMAIKPFTETVNLPPPGSSWRTKYSPENIFKGIGDFDKPQQQKKVQDAKKGAFDLPFGAPCRSSLSPSSSVSSTSPSVGRRELPGKEDPGTRSPLLSSPTPSTSSGESRSESHIAMSLFRDSGPFSLGVFRMNRSESSIPLLSPEETQVNHGTFKDPIKPLALKEPKKASRVKVETAKVREKESILKPLKPLSTEDTSKKSSDQQEEDNKSTVPTKPRRPHSGSLKVRIEDTKNVKKEGDAGSSKRKCRLCARENEKREQKRKQEQLASFLESSKQDKHDHPDAGIRQGRPNSFRRGELRSQGSLDSAKEKEAQNSKPTPPLLRSGSLDLEKAEKSQREEPMGLSRDVSTSQDSLQSDIGGAPTLHRYYHVFREGELDQLIEKYVHNLHIISSYYDHANWCVVAEKVQVWTI